MNDEFVQRALRYGEEGKAWLANIPNLISIYEQKWKIKVSDAFVLSYNYVAPAIRIDDAQVVIKLGFPKDREFQTGINALEVFSGQGIENLLESDKEHAAILVDRVMPGKLLSTIDDDGEATVAIATVMKNLWKPLPQQHSFITIIEWVSAIPRYQATYKGNGPLPQQIVDKAEKLFTELIATSASPVLVHGDLHHDNVLSSSQYQWVAIDPKGIAAEPAYETAAMMRNPHDKLSSMDSTELSSVLRNRILILSRELNFDPQRIRKWAFAQTVLSAVWDLDEGKKPDYTIRIANMLDSVTL